MSIFFSATIDLPMSDISDLEQVTVVSPSGNSDDSSVSAVISMPQAVPNLCVSRKVFLKQRVNRNTVWQSIFFADNPIDTLNEQ